MRLLAPAVFLAVLIQVGPAAAQECPDVPEDRRGAVRLADLTTDRGDFRDLAMQGVDSQLEQSPQMRLLRPAFVEFFEEHFPYGRMLCLHAATYVELLSEQEMASLLAFYGTELGQRLLEIQPRLVESMMEISDRLIEENQEELQALLVERSQEVTDSLEAAQEVDVK